MSATARVLMCPPDHFGIEYEINPWMKRERQAVHALAVEQWRGLTALLSQAGARLEFVSPRSGLPDLVFTANAGLPRGDRVVLARFRHPQRQGEEPVFAEWFAEHGFEVACLPENVFFEGAGDALFCGETLYLGYRQRSQARGAELLGKALDARVVPLELVDPYYYHLDTCFCPLAPGAAIYYPPAFDAYALRVLHADVPDLIAAAPDEAAAFACNAVVAGRVVITNDGCPKLHEELRRRGFTPRATPLGEFVKAGGSAKCLTLRLDGEEAAKV